jgi:hypothetical protein
VAEGDLIRAFPVSSLRTSIDAALAGLPPGVPVAVMAHADLEGAKLHVFGRIGSQFSYVGVLDKQYDKPFKGEIALVWYPGFGG